MHFKLSYMHFKLYHSAGNRQIKFSCLVTEIGFGIHLNDRIRSDILSEISKQCPYILSVIISSLTVKKISFQF